MFTTTTYFSLPFNFIWVSYRCDFYHDYYSGQNRIEVIEGSYKKVFWKIYKKN